LNENNKFVRTVWPTLFSLVFQTTPLINVDIYLTENGSHW